MTYQLALFLYGDPWTQSFAWKRCCQCWVSQPNEKEEHWTTGRRALKKFGVLWESAVGPCVCTCVCACTHIHIISSSTTIRHSGLRELGPQLSVTFPNYSQHTAWLHISQSFQHNITIIMFLTFSATRWKSWWVATASSIAASPNNHARHTAGAWYIFSEWKKEGRKEAKPLNCILTQNYKCLSPENTHFKSPAMTLMSSPWLLLGWESQKQHLAAVSFHVFQEREF